MNPDMKRLKLLAAIAVLGIPLAACEEATPPPPVGSIVGTVSIEGTGIDGVSVNLSNGNSTTTAGGGSYRFDNVEGGAYTVTISGYPSDATFDATSAAATISTAGQSVTLNFNGSYIRTASVMGSVTVENMGLPGVTVTLTGVSGATAVTDDGGQYAFTGLRMGSYSVEISGFDSDEVGFSNTAASVSVGVGESKIVSFDGTYLRTAGIMGRVSVEGEGLEGVTVSLAGGPDNTDMTTMTDAAGQYSFAKLRAGDYAVGISGYDTDDFEFEVTSQNVTVALGETANVPFEGVLLRTSGISGRVSVEGMGLDSIMVTLSMADADDMTAMTDVGGLYAFSGLSAGDYTVAISVESDAYVFDSMSMDVTVSDDETAIVNFEGMHARTASVSGMLFIDELMKNDMMDEGEAPLPHAGVPVVLVGPGVSDQVPSVTDSTGAFSFMGLRAGIYQLVVPVTGPMGDFAYGGSATGYEIELGVGEAHTRNLPIDITHTTVNFSVMLKSGEMTGDALPGAAVTLYSDMAGNSAVGSDTTDAEGMASIRFARASTTGNTVHAGISAEGYSGPEGMQAVMWNPQMTMTAASNDGDIVNLNVDVTVSGATITTAYGGGKALSGWAISVMSGDEAVEGAPAALDADGMAAFKTTVAAVPATYTFAVADDQANAMDGGEKYMGNSVTYTHDGLSLAGTMDAGTMEVNYTTQTLKVYVHHEKDQVHGYTGNILGGDYRSSVGIDVGIRHIDDSGRSRAFPSSAKISSPRTNGAKGVWSFSNVPADANVIVQADEVAGSNVKLLDPDELAAYRDMEVNGITGGAFGAMGGFHHTVELCPLMNTDPAGQDHGECGSFAFVSTYAVSGLVWKRGVKLSGDDFAEVDPVFVAGQTVSLDPVAGKNLAGEAESATTTEKPVKGPGETSKGTEVLDETHQFDFGRIAAGVYKLSVPDGWRARMGAKGAEAMLGNALNPLGGDLAIDVTPATATVYGRVNGSDGFPLDSVTVTINGRTAETDESGRYIIDGIAPQTRTIKRVKYTNKVFVQASRAGYDESSVMVLDFAANSVTRHDFAVAGTAATATVSGTVTAFGSSTPIAGVEIRVDGIAPINKNAKSVRTKTANDIYVTGADGTYSISVPATNVGETAEISAHKDGFTFTPASLELSTPKGSAVSGINFAGVANSSISGRVQAPGGGPLSGVVVTATASGASEAADTDTTGVTGTYSLSVPAGTYEMAFSKAGHSFNLPQGTTSWMVTVGLGQSVSFAQVESSRDPDPPSDDATLSALSLSAGTLAPAFASGVDTYTAEVASDVGSTTVTATANDANATVAIMPADADASMVGHQVDLAVGANTITATVTAEDGTTTMAYTVTVTRDAGPSDDATLSGLSLSGVMLNPSFAGGINTYTATVGYNTASTTVTATANSSMASVAIVPADADAEAAGHQVDLRVGRTDITVRVTAEDGTEMDYTVAVTRDAAPSADAALHELSLSDVTLSPEFSAGALNYTASVENDVAQTTVTATQRHSAARVGIEPADDDADMDGHQVDLDVGANTITVTVTAEDGTAQTYTVTVTRAQSSDATLSSLDLTGVTLDPAFDAATTAYTASVGNDVEKTTVEATANSDAARVVIVPADDDTDMAGHQVDLDVGANSITVTVTAEDGTRADYTVTVTRRVPSATDLEKFVVGDTDVMLEDGEYRIEVENSLSRVTVEAVAVSPATATITSPDDADNATAGHQVDLEVGDNTITAEVTDGIETATYTLTVTRKEPSATDLEKFVVNDADVMADASGDFAHEVENSVTQVTVEAVPVESATAVITSPADADGTTAGHQVNLEVGANTITATVTAADGVTEDTHELTITRKEGEPGIVVSVEEIALGEGDSTTYMVSLATRPENDVTVAITAVAASDTTTTLDLGTANDPYISASSISRAFTPSNWDRPQSVQIKAGEDDTDFADHEDITLRHDATSSDADYNGERAVITVDITDDDVSGAAVALTDSVGITPVTALTVEEGEEGSYWVALAAEPKSDVTVTIASGDGVNVTPSTLTFTKGNFGTRQKVTVAAPDNDIDADADGTATLTHTAAGGGYDDATLTANTVAVTITDDDTAGVTVSPTALQVMEGETGTYTIKLNTNPDGVVVISAVSPTTATVTLSPPTLTFNASNWKDEQTVTVTAVDDTVTAANVDVTIANGVVSAQNAKGYSTTTAVDDVTVTAVDDETAQVLVTPTALSIAQGAEGTFRVRLTQAPGTGETVTISSSGAGGLNILGGSVLTFTASDWTAKSVRIGVPQSTEPGSLTVTTQLTTSATSGGYSGASVSDVTVTVTAAAGS